MALAERIQKPEIEIMTSTGCTKKRRLKPTFKQKWLLPAAGVLFCLTVCNVIVQGLVVDKTYQIRRWEKLINEQEREIVKLKVDIAALESFERVQYIAKNELGMKAAEAQDYRLIPSVPAGREDYTPNSGYNVADRDAGLLNKIAAWFGGIGKTMANTP
ncbi:MAG TPA: hypothetical protein VEC37_18335 [Bacillota bacterium]|nr:hypothetical protein [Bacillota bacterium]